MKSRQSPKPMNESSQNTKLRPNSNVNFGYIPSRIMRRNRQKCWNWINLLRWKFHHGMLLGNKNKITIKIFAVAFFHFCSYCYIESVRWYDCVGFIITVKVQTAQTSNNNELTFMWPDKQKQIMPSKLILNWIQSENMKQFLFQPRVKKQQQRKKNKRQNIVQLSY